MRRRLSKTKLFLYIYLSTTVVMIIKILFELKYALVSDNDSHVFPERSDIPATLPTESFKLYYFRYKDVQSTVNVSILPLFHKEDTSSDRLVNQLLYRPPDYENYVQNLSIHDYKNIYLAQGPKAYWKTYYGNENFVNCSVHTCNIVKHDSIADLVVYKRFFEDVKERSHPEQILMFYELESPPNMEKIYESFDWVSTYRRDSDIVAPYDRWEYYDKEITQQPQSKNYADGKTKKVAWFVSNCEAKNNRLDFAKDLREHIDVDIYGYCGDQGLECSRDDSDECLRMLEKDYKFYLAFENSNCRDYITEKVFNTALQHNILPIVMGGFPEDYQKVLPEKSFIHVNEFPSVEKLAEYLHILDHNDTLYNSYFQWKGTGEIIDTDYWCRVCAMLHAPKDKSLYRLSDVSFEEWWNGEGICEKFKDDDYYDVYDQKRVTNEDN